MALKRPRQYFFVDESFGIFALFLFKNSLEVHWGGCAIISPVLIQRYPTTRVIRYLGNLVYSQSSKRGTRQYLLLLALTLDMDSSSICCTFLEGKRNYHPHNSSIFPHYKIVRQSCYTVHRSNTLENCTTTFAKKKMLHFIAKF